MREIKFRVWDKKSKVMRSLDSIAFDANNNVKLVNAWGYDIIEGKMVIVRREKRYELLQYTGLEDKDGVEIYVGDIVLIDGKTTHEIIINDFMQIPVIDSELGQQNLYQVNRNCEVISNIYENPELLEDK